MVIDKTYLELNGESILKSRGITKTQFAEKMGIKPQNVKKWLATTDVKNLMRISEILGVPLGYLLFGETSTEGQVNGYLEAHNTIYKITSKEDILQVLKALE